MPKLKVFRTPIGFHDAYVAAPSRKAALKAWGAEADLFARGEAEEVTDAGLAEAPLASPGTVIRVARGTAAEHLAALPPAPAPTRRARKQADAPVEPRSRTTPSRPPRQRKPTPKPPPRPRPSRDALDATEAALAEAERRHATIRRELAEREAALTRERRAAETERDRETAHLLQARDTAAADYRRALLDWKAR